MRSYALLGVLLLPALFGTAHAAPDSDPEQVAAWPQEIASPDGSKLVVYQPQVDRWADEVLDARVAVALQFAGDDDVLYGALWIRADTRTNLDTRVVTAANLRITEARFPATGTHAQAEVLGRLRDLFPQGPLDLALDQILADVERAAVQAPARGIELGPEVPDILVEERPARLVLLDGEPVLHPVPGTQLMHVVNTTWHVLLEAETGRYFLRLDGSWMTAADLTATVWTPSARPPRDLAKIPPDHPRAEASAPGTPLSGPLPRVHVRTRPTELVLIAGPPALTPIPGTSLLYVTNTKSDLFFHRATARYFFLAAGRWLSAPSLAGPWQEADDLPDDFALIPSDHAKAGVRVSVPGTPDAEEALILAQIPRRTVVRRAEAKLVVTYDGAPRFQRCTGSAIAYALNTDDDVLLVDGRYYCCRQGIWFLASAPLGPWAVCDSVPAIVYTIRPHCPVYRVTYVRVYDATPELVAFGYLPGYLGLYVSSRRRVVVFGTGWHYRPWIHAGVWHGWPLTFGLGVSYHPYVSGFVFGVTYDTPYVRRPLRSMWYPYTATYYARYRTTNVYARWGARTIHDHDAWLRRSHVTSAQGPTRGFGSRAAPPRVVRHAPAAATRHGDLYVGRDGRIYRQAESGWQRRDGTTWQTPARGAPAPVPQRPPTKGVQPRPAEPRAPVPPGLDRDSRSRRVGVDRVRQYDRWRSTEPSIRQRFAPVPQPRQPRAPPAPQRPRKER